MSQGQGSSGYFAIQEESTYKTAPGTPDTTKIHVLPGLTFSRTRPNIVSTVLGSNRNPRKPTRGNADLTGSFTTHVNPSKGFCLLLKGLLGSVVSSTGTLAYDAQSGNFTQGLTVTGGTSAATSVIVYDKDDGTSGTLYLSSVSGTWQNNENITDTSTGDATVDGTYTAGLPYAHRFTVGNTIPSWFSEVGYTDIDEYLQYLGNVVGEGTINADATGGGIQEASFSMAGATNNAPAQTAFDTPSDPGHSPFGSADISSVKIGGTALTDLVRSISFTYTNNLDLDQFVIGGGGIKGSIPSGSVVIEGTIDMLFKNDTYLDLARAGTETSIEVVYSFGTGTGAADNESVIVSLPEILLEEADPGLPTDGGIVHVVPFTAYYDNNATTTGANITVLNTVATI